MAERVLQRSTTNRIIAGVCGGLGEYFDIDPTIVRVVFVLLSFFSFGFGIFLYLVLALVIPEAGQPATRTAAAKLQKEIAHDIKVAPNDSKPSYFFAIGLIIFGLILLLDNLSLLRPILPYTSVGDLWPLIVVFLGLWLLFRK